jgi:PPK2 family polyphosphate:nucleotide phosphotransferase
LKIHSNDFRVKPGKKVDLKEWPTIRTSYFKTKDEYQNILEAHVGRLSELQQLHYASGRYALLLIFQGMDAAGKDGAIRHVLSGVNPEGCEVFSFKQPSAEELKHDFIWRTTCRLPELGRIGIFNRSYYEEVLIARVHPEILLTQNLPKKSLGDASFWRDRYRSIVDLERHLHRNGTQIIKCFLHLSKKEQAKRFIERIDDPECLGATTTRHAPWYAIPADDKENARLIVSQILIEAFEDLKMAYPKSSEKHLRELQSIRKALTK